MNARLDRWDVLLLAALPFAAVMLACAATPVDTLERANPDVLLYFRDAGHVAAGQLPYRDFPFEYPPLAILAMALPYVAWPVGQPSLLEFQWLWAFQNALLASVVSIGVGWIASRPGSPVSPARAMLTWAVVALIEAPLIAWRFDIAAVALAVTAVVLLLARRPGTAGAALAVGALIKIFPAALLPVMVAWQLARDDGRGAGRLVATFAVTAGGALVVAIAVAGPEAVGSFLTYQDDRLVQLESVASSVLLLGHLLLSVPVALVYGFQSLQVDGSGTRAFLAIEWPLMVLSVSVVSGLAYARFRSERHRDGRPSLSALVGYLFAVTAVLIASNKVFSAQYLLWVLPFGCLLPRRQAALVIVVALLSIAIFPLGYAELSRFEPHAILVLVARNALLLGLAGWVIVRYRPLGLGNRASALGDRPLATG